MITFLDGKLANALPTQAIVDVGGVGYEVFIPLSSYDKLPAVGQTIRILTHLAVREDAHVLYGFMTPAERDLFRLLVNNVSGIGPKLAVTILSGMATADMVGAIRSNDFARLTKIPGVGRKTAERMCVELRDKLEVFGVPQPVISHSAVEEDVISALTNLGYQRALSEKGVERALQSAGRENFDAIFRAALAALSK